MTNTSDIRLALSCRVRSTPFSDRVEEAGVSHYSVYNGMVLPAAFGDMEAECEHLKNHVQVWDVSCERQVEIKGPDAAKLVQLMTPRDISKGAINQCLYIPIVDENGCMVNDPVAIKLAEEHYWISIADSDVILYAKGIAAGRGLKVEISEPDVNPLAIQGPKAGELMERVFGETVNAIRFFRGDWLEFQGKRLFVARSGYSKQGGFEVYCDSVSAVPLWDALFTAGADLNVKAGGPNTIERIESGLLSCGNDMELDDTPFEAGLGQFCHLDGDFEFIGKEALLAKREPFRQLRGLKIEGRLPGCRRPWPVQGVGKVTSAVYSPTYGCTVAIAMIDKSHWTPGTKVTVDTPEGPRTAEVCPLPFPPASA